MADERGTRGFVTTLTIAGLGLLGTRNAPSSSDSVQSRLVTVWVTNATSRSNTRF